MRFVPRVLLVAAPLVAAAPAVAAQESARIAEADGSTPTFSGVSAYARPQLPTPIRFAPADLLANDPSSYAAGAPAATSQPFRLPELPAAELSTGTKVAVAGAAIAAAVGIFFVLREIAGSSSAGPPVDDPGFPLPDERLVVVR